MEALTNLRANVNTLTREHVKLYAHENHMESGMVPGLIQQLHLEQGISNDGAGASSGKPIPLNAGPFDLLQKITTALRKELEPYGFKPTSLTLAIRNWSVLCEHREDLTLHAAIVTAEWIKEVVNLFDPVKRTDVKGDCPECKGTAHDNGRMDDDGHWIPTAPLTRVEEKVTCSMCGAAWSGMLELQFLVIAIDAAQAAKDREEEAATHGDSALSEVCHIG